LRPWTQKLRPSMSSSTWLFPRSSCKGGRPRAALA
jgi:hypothetical protein